MNRGKECVVVGLLGCGTIGSGVYHLLMKNHEIISKKAGREIFLKRILVKDIDEPRPFKVDASLMTTKPKEVIDDPEIDVFIELIGGLKPARSFALSILSKGKHLVTANKELLAHHGGELVSVADKNASHLMFEASVGGGIPLIRPIEGSLGGDRILRIMGIVNGTTNYILTKMSEERCTFKEALLEAKNLGYAEANPRNDLEGHDAASKLAILSSISFRAGVTSSQIYREGIDRIRPEDIDNARELGYVVKLLAIASLNDGEICARVHPTMIPLEHPLASILGNFNAIFVVGESAGELMFYGQGAGSLPTSVAIIGDLINVVKNIDRLPDSRSYWSNEAKMGSFDEVITRFYMVLRVVDRPGVLAKIADVFGRNKVSLESVVQKGEGREAQIVLITHEVKERNFQEARRGLEGLDVILDIPSVIRVESA
ncbi:MAG: homoserine dehydrogenase [Actinomycetota bacterium]|nr:homoserine dehydrogenase [Actinomycetota bacterium]